MFIDAHAHLDREYFKKETPEAVLDRAFQAGVEQLLVVGLGLESARNAVRLAETHPGRLFAVVGVHPHDAAGVDDDLFEAIADLAGRPEVVGVGETGLDYHYDHSPREVQREVFRRTCELARSLDKPLVVHTREADEDTARILASEAPFPAGGQIHSFTGSREVAAVAEDIGFHLSLSGVLTFNNAEALRETVRGQPLDRLLIETDSPYLAPAPFRGRKNEPRYVAATCGALARLHGQTVAETARRTTANTRRLFRLPPPPAPALRAFAAGQVLQIAVHPSALPVEAFLESAASWPLDKIKRVSTWVAPGAVADPARVEAVAAWAAGVGRPFDPA